MLPQPRKYLWDWELIKEFEAGTVRHQVDSVQFFQDLMIYVRFLKILDKKRVDKLLKNISVPPQTGGVVPHIIKSPTFIWRQRFCPVISYLHMMNRSLYKRQASISEVDKKIPRPTTIQEEVAKRSMMETDNRIVTGEFMT
jgi:hypothetical protein